MAPQTEPQADLAPPVTRPRESAKTPAAAATAGHAPWTTRVTHSLLHASIAFLRDVALPVVLLAVGAVWWTYGDRRWATLHDHPVTWLFVVFGAVEGAFWLYTRVKVLQIQASGPAPRMTPAERLQLFHRCLESVAPHEYSDFISGWFRKAPFEEIRRGNVEQWLAWAFFDERLRLLTVSERNEIDHLIHLMETHLGRLLPSGFNRNIKSIRLMLDPVEVHHRPLTFYIVVAGLRLAHELYLAASGYRRCQTGPIVFWYRRAALSGADKLPLVFAHGLGIGLSQYYNFIKHINTLDNPVFLVEINDISSRLVETNVPMEQAVPALVQMLHDFGFERAVWMGHSFGSVYVSWIIRQAPEVVAKAVLLDPVVLLLNSPSVCYNFVYRTPTNAIQAALQYYAARELYISKSISRHFHWVQNILWPHDIHVPTLVMLSSTDAITDAVAVRAYLERIASPHIDVMWLDGIGHAGFLFRAEVLARVFRRIAALIQQD